MSVVIGIEPTAATAIDLRTGHYANRRRAAYPRSLVNLAAILREPARARKIAKGLGIYSYPVDSQLSLSMDIHDRIISDFEFTEDIPARESDYIGPVTYYQGVRYGESAEATSSFIRSHPDARIIAIPGIFSGSRTEVLESAHIAKVAKPDALVVVGGTYASADYLFLLQSGWIDAVLIGEGWLSFPALVHTYLQEGRLNGVPGIAYRTENDELVDNTRIGSGFYPPIEDYDQIPYPAWDILDFVPYDEIGLTHLGETPGGQLVAPLDSEIGCGFQCRFCAAGYLNGRRIVKKSARRIFDEIRFLVEQFGRNMIHFDSDNPLIDSTRSLELFQLLKEYNHERLREGKATVRFAFPNGTAPWTFRDSRVIPAMLKAGLCHISIALESASTRLLRTLGKTPKTPRLVYDAIRSIRDWERQVGRFTSDPVIIEVFVMIGVPGEMKNDLMETVSFCEKLSAEFDVIIAPFYFAPLHGTPLFSAFFKENPGARRLSWPVLGWLGTEKKDNPDSNESARRARKRLYSLSRCSASAGFVRL